MKCSKTTIHGIIIKTKDWDWVVVEEKNILSARGDRQIFRLSAKNLFMSWNFEKSQQQQQKNKTLHVTVCKSLKSSNEKLMKQLKKAEILTHH